MKFVEHFERVKKMNRLIKSGQTGTPEEFAKTIGICTSHLYRYLAEMEQYGLSIEYSRSLKTYFYRNNCELAVYYSLKVVSGDHAREILGG
jgi:hypothetical protein